MANFLDLTGKNFGRLNVLGISRKVQSGKRYRYYWDCLCECGNRIEVRTDGLTQGMTQSCGCLKNEQNKFNLTANHSHKLSHSKLWNTYYSMKKRCNNQKDKRYSDYGARGIKVCEEWENDFGAFVEWALTNGYDDNLTIDRKDNDGNYEPSNCRWADLKTQSRNRRSNIIVDYNGKQITLIELSEILNIPYGTIYRRYRRGSRLY